MGSVNVRKETGKLVLDFRYRGTRYREQTDLENTPANRKKVEKFLDRIETEIKLGTFDYARHFPNSKTAVRLAAATAHPVAVMVATTAASTPTAITRVRFAEFAKTWEQENAVQWRRSYQRTISDIVDQHLIPLWGERDVGSLSREEILKFRSELAKAKGRKKETLSPRRINAIMNVMRQILNEASDRYKFNTPFYNIKALKNPKSDVEPFSLEEVRQILDNVRADFRDYYLVRFFTGMRTGEIDGLKWKYIDLERRQILVRETFVLGEMQEGAKTIESTRDIRMSQVVYDALVRQKGRTESNSEYVFCNREGNPLDHDNITKRVWYPILRHLNLKPRRPYQTRHTAATLWLAAGEAPEWIARQMGHTSTEMLFKVYSRYVPNLTRQDGSAFDRLLLQSGTVDHPVAESNQSQQASPGNQNPLTVQEAA